MPIYEYEPQEGECGICRGRFTLNRPVSASPLAKCPLCKKPVRKLVSAFNTPQLTKPLSAVDAKKAGFSVWKKRGQGEYERE
jgi:putative FmdB family regulatory protein